MSVNHQQTHAVALSVCDSDAVLLFYTMLKTLSDVNSKCRGAITAPCDVCNTHRPVAEVVSVKETCSETPADLPVNRVSSPHNNANENNVEAKAQPWGTSSNRPAPNAGTDGESDSMLDTHAISGREERDSAGERLQEGKEQSADVDEVVMGEQDLSDKGDHVPEERTLTTGVKGTEERPTNDTVLQGPLDVELEELKLEDTEVAGSQRSASDASDDEDLQPKLSLAELRTITLANSLAGLPPDAPVDWQEWGLSSKDTASLEKLNGTVRAHCGTAGQTSGGSGDDQTNWKVCAGCRRLKKSWGGTFEDLKAAIAEGAVMVSHVNASDGSKSDPYSKVCSSVGFIRLLALMKAYGSAWHNIGDLSASVASWYASEGEMV